MLMVWPGNTLPSNCLGVQDLKPEVGNQGQGGVTLKDYCSQVPLLCSSPCMYNVLPFHHIVLSTPGRLYDYLPYNPHFLALVGQQ